MERRAFLALSAAAGAAARAAPRLPLKAPPPWYATMRRCGQLNFNERDPLTLDVAAWIDYWASLRVGEIRQRDERPRNVSATGAGARAHQDAGVRSNAIGVESNPARRYDGHRGR